MVLVVLLTALCRTVMATPSVLLKVSPAPTAWAGNGIEDKLIIRMSRDSSIHVIRADNVMQDERPFPADLYNLDSLVDWGMEAGGQYLLVVDVHSERLERRKSFHIPLFFHKYSTFGVISGEMRMIDLRSGQAVIAEPFQTELEAKRIFQASTDDDINHPDLRLTSPGKIRFFDRLENKLCDQLLESIGFTERGNNSD